jgi:uncharacterized membrane protein YfcA
MGSVSFSRAGKGVALATAAALLLTAVEPQVAQARSSSPTSVAAGNGVAASSVTDVSARRRHVRRRRHSGNAAGLAFMGMALGTMGAIIAEQQRRDYYRDRYYYGGYPYYGRPYYGPYYYYGY